MELTVWALARASSFVSILPLATAASSLAMTATMSPACIPSATPEMPMIPVSSKTLWKEVQFCAHACLLSTLL